MNEYFRASFDINRKRRILKSVNNKRYVSYMIKI